MMQQIVETLQSFAQQHLGQILVALAILVGGWLVALVISALFRLALKRTEIDNRLAQWLVGEEKIEGIDVEKWMARLLFYLLMVFVLVGFFQALGLTLVTEPLNRFLNQVFEYLPRLIAPIILLLGAWMLATGLRFVVHRVLTAARLDDRLGHGAGMDDDQAIPIAKTISDSVYWLIFLLALPAVLSILDLQGLLSPVQSMVDKVLAFLPHLFAALLILAVGWLLARIVQRVVSNLLAAVGLDRLSAQVGLDTALGDQKLSRLLGLVLYVLILIPVLIASLNALQLDAITSPASAMLDTILSALPLVFAAALVLTIAFFVGRLVSGLLTNVLAGIGFDGILEKLGLGSAPSEGRARPSQLAGNLVLVAIMLFASIEAVNLLGFEVLGTLIAEFLVFAGQVALGLVIFAVGLFLANLAARTIEAGASAQAALLAMAARVSILVLAGAMSLRQMGLANEIIVLAFGLLMGAIAVAAAIAFGIGGRDLARTTLEGWAARLDAGSDSSA
jgi:hypothetical protein